MSTPEDFAQKIAETIYEHRTIINFMSNNLDVQLNGKHPADGIGLGLITIKKCIDQLAGATHAAAQDKVREGALLFVLQWLSNADGARTLKVPGMNDNGGVH